MKTAGAIVTDRGGRTCHAAIVARELGVPAVVGGEGGDRNAARPASVSRCRCADGEAGNVYDGKLPFEVTRLPASALPNGRAPRSWSISAIPISPSIPRCCRTTASAWRGWSSSSASTSACIRWRWCIRRRSPRRGARAHRIAQRATIGSPRDFFVAHAGRGRRHDRRGVLSQAGDRAAVRLQDQRICATCSAAPAFEPKEDNPMLGFRGASRYAHPAYADGFALECEALRRVRERDGADQSARHGAVLPPGRGGGAGDRGDGAATGCSAARTGWRST